MVAAALSAGDKTKVRCYPMHSSAQLVYSTTPLFQGQLGGRGTADRGLRTSTHLPCAGSGLETAPTPQPHLLATTPPRSCLAPVQAGETIMQALGLATVLGITVTVGLTAQADSALQLMGLPMDGTGDPQMTALARDFLMVR